MRLAGLAPAPMRLSARKLSRSPDCRSISRWNRKPAMFIPSVTDRYRFAQAGISLIELIMFMVIVSVGLAGILSVMTVTTRASADPMLRKQAIAVAESLLEEIQLQPFTFCDPD